MPESRSFRARRGAVLCLSWTAAAGLLAAIAFWWSFLFEHNLHAVVEGEIYRSGQPSPALLRRWTDELGLRSVINLRGESQAYWFTQEASVAASLGLHLDALRLSSDRMPSPAALARLVRMLDEAPRPVLVHCGWGTERTGLVSAVARLLEGERPERARDAFGLRYGYAQPLSGSRLPEVVDDYRAWLAARGLAHEPDRFRAWVESDYVPLFYRAQIELLEMPERIATGEPVPLRLRVTNRSARPWRFGRDREEGVHLWLGVFADAASEHPRRRVRFGFEDAPLAPGASTEIEVELEQFRKPGRYRLEIDLMDGMLTSFAAMGSEPLWLDVEVTDAAPTPI